MIVECFAEKDPQSVPAVLVKNHGPFTWGQDALRSVDNSVVLEQVAMMAYVSRDINALLPPMKNALLDKHYLRKHGENAYYGQR